MSHAAATAERLIPNARRAVWGLIADPNQHHRFDATGMVQTLASSAPRAVGDVFRMRMSWTDGDSVENYQSDNHVTRYEPERVIAWATALPGQPPLGWTWTYELEDAPAGTLVRLTYDWSLTPEQNMQRFGVPITDDSGLARSLALLEQACGTS